jgi:hypothetical protein
VPAAALGPPRRTKKSAVDFSAAVQFGALFVEFVVVAGEAQGFANVPPLGRGLIATAVSAGPRHDPWQD